MLDEQTETGNFTAFHLACRHGQDNIVKILIKNCKNEKMMYQDKDATGQNGFMGACWNGKLSVINCLLDLTSDRKDTVDARNDAGSTGFILACMQGHKSVVNRLLEITGEGEVKVDDKTKTGIATNNTMYWCWIFFNYRHWISVDPRY